MDLDKVNFSPLVEIQHAWKLSIKHVFKSIPELILIVVVLAISIGLTIRLESPVFLFLLLLLYL
jgi:hypothetical protein